MTLNITLPNGSVAHCESGTKILEFVRTSIGEGLARAALSASIDGVNMDLFMPLTKDCKIVVHTAKDETGKKTLWHSTAHVLAIAALRLFPTTKLTIGPSTDDGFYYDFAVDKPFTAQDIVAIEEEMKKVIKEDLPFSRSDIEYTKAKTLFAENKFKLEIIEDHKDEPLSLYHTGDFFDLCMGPHIPSTGKIKAVKLLRISGAYWRGDSTKEQLQRVYGISFTNPDELKVYVDRIELSKARDHRKLAAEHELVMFHEYAPGNPFFLAKGAVIYNQLLDFIRKEYNKRGYTEVITPQMFHKSLWETSGHWEHYKNDMFILNIEGQEHSLKPMNCPSHCLIYKHKAHSYRELPIRIADFCFLHRNELSGALSGLTRVRKFSQDDAHIFCREDQAVAEIASVLEFIDFAWRKVFGIKLTYFISTRPEKSLGTAELWEKAEKMLADALIKANIPYGIKQGDGAFYGPKIDMELEDALGRRWQCPTCQLDFNLPERFDLTFEGSDGKQHRPVMIHRAVLGSLERCFAMLVENYAGKFPLWLSPVQVRLLPIADRHIDYCKTVEMQFRGAGIRVETDERALTTPNKVRLAQTEHVNYILVVGDSEIKNSTINVRTRDNTVLGEKAVADVIAQILKEVGEYK